MVEYIGANGATTLISNSLVWSVGAILLAVIIGLYVLRGIGLSKLAKREGIKVWYLAWIPFAWFYVAGKLCLNIKFFDKPFKNFALFAVLFCGTIEFISVAISLFVYVPVVGFFMQGGTVMISAYAEYIPTGSTIFNTGSIYLGLAGFNDPFSTGFWDVINVINTVSGILDLVSIIIQVMIFSNIFRSFLPRHSLVATIFSLFGFFGPFVFAVRNNQRFDYQEYMRKRYQAFYGNGYPYNQYGVNNQPQSPSEEKTPFDEFEKSQDSKDDNDPFSEF